MFNLIRIFKPTLIYTKYPELIMDLGMTNKEVFSTPPVLNPIFLTSTNATCITCSILLFWRKIFFSYDFAHNLKKDIFSDNLQFFQDSWKLDSIKNPKYYDYFDLRFFK